MLLTRGINIRFYVLMSRIFAKKNMDRTVSGFSRFSTDEKIRWISETFFANPAEAADLIRKYRNSDAKLQQLHDEFIENTVTNFYLPLGIAPNFTINGKTYAVPMAIEESSVVAAAAKAAKFWSARGGFNATVIGTEKMGHVHFLFHGSYQKLQSFFDQVKSRFFDAAENITRNMVKRGGGITSIELVDKTSKLDNYYQIQATFQTKDSMGANFINSCLETFAKTLVNEAKDFSGFDDDEKDIEVIMSILTNYLPNCTIKAEVSCKIEDLRDKNIDDPQKFADKFVQAVKISEIEPYRAVTHNKGIMNGIDAVVIATGNDFRAVEAGIHAYASRSGKYRGLSKASVENGIFTFSLEVPLALGTVGGLTSLHPLVKLCLEILGNPSAEDLMKIVAVTGLAQNFAALRSLTTTGIQEGHMKMHLNNIINQFKATKEERDRIRDHFSKKTVSHSGVAEFLESLRK